MTTMREEFEAWAKDRGHYLKRRADGVYMDSSACKAWDAWQAAHLAGQRAMQTRAEEVANKTAERILAANTHRGRTSSAGSFASGVAEDIGCDIRALEVKPS